MSMKRTKIYNNVVDHRVLFDGYRCEDITSVTPPNLEHPTDTLEGEGLTADLEVANQSKVNAMELKIAHNNGVNCQKLKQPGVHKIEFRIARQRYNVPKSAMGYESVKYYFSVQHKGTEAGTVERGNPLGDTENFAVLSYKKVADGKVIDHVDASAGILKLDGKDCVKDLDKILD